MSQKYEYKVTAFNAEVLDKDKDKINKIRDQLQDQMETHANDGWEFDSQLTFGYVVKETGCFGGSTGKAASEGTLYQLVFKREI
jgi:hypothetical protein